MAIVYGRLTDYELEKQGKDPYIETGGRRYRITELVRRLDGGANYQATEVTDSDPQPVEPAMPKPTPLMSVGGGVHVIHEPEPPAIPPRGEPDPILSLVPSVKDWTKAQGLYKGRGPISEYARKKYREEFGDEVYEGRKE